MLHRIGFLAFLLGIALPVFSAQTDSAPSVAKHFNTNRVRADLQFLADDLLEGRGTGARGGDLAANYIAAQFEIAGLKPFGDEGTFFQKVPLTGVNVQPETTLEFQPAKGDSISGKYLDDFVVNPYNLKPDQKIDAPVVFAGYGVVAPEYHWNDYEGLDVKGKVVIVLVNDPPSQDEKFFGGKAMTYYGRWTYKYEEGARQGAAGVLIVHKTETAAYGWEVVRNSWSGEQAFLPPEPGINPLSMAGWIQEDQAKKLFAASGMDLAEWMEKAGTPGFKAVELPLTAHAHVVANVRPLHAQNVVGILEGSDPKLKKEAIIYSAHYDHLGIGNAVNGDSIYNGAIDNASGTAILIELARAFTEAGVRPKRSVIFLSVTGEERGLIGSQYFGLNPPIPAKDLMLDLNYDAIYLFGRTSDVVVAGAERTTVWPIVQRVAKNLKLDLTPDSHPEGGHYYRSDHFSLARVGVPSFSIDNGDQYVGKPENFGDMVYKEYVAKTYHQPSDEFNPNWDYSCAEEVADLGIYVGLEVANSSTPTGWNPGDEFDKIRKSGAK